nr:NADH-quinone oxidoreductase subunit M [Melghirimyces algeriensis]
MENVLNMLPTWLAFSPLLGAMLLLLVPQKRTGWLKRLGILATFPPLVLALLLYGTFHSGMDSVQFEHRLQWFEIPLSGGASWELTYHMGVDGLSMPLVVMATVVATLAAFASTYIQKRQKEYFLFFLILEMGMLGVFLAQNLFLFFLFFEITLVSLYFLIGIWGFVHRERAANQFLLYNGLGSAFLLISLVGLLVLFGTLDFNQLQELSDHPRTKGVLSQSPLKEIVWGIFLSMVVAFGIKLPIFPFHRWMLKVHTEAPPAVVMVHSGVLLKMGAYGLIRFGVQLFPDQMRTIATTLAVLGLVNILYGAVLAFVQQDLKRVLAYASISHMGIILFGVASANVSGLTGAVFQAVSHGLISAVLFFFIASLVDRAGTTEIGKLGGMARSAPVLTGVFLAGGLALLGLPGMSGFVSEFLVFVGLFQQEPALAAVGILGLVLTAAYTLRAVLATGFGPLKSRLSDITDIKPSEAAPMLMLLAFILLIGVYPDVLGEPIKATMQMIASRIGG